MSKLKGVNFAIILFLPFRGFDVVVNLSLQIYVVDSLDRERIGKARAEFQVVYSERYAECITVLSKKSF